MQPALDLFAHMRTRPPRVQYAREPEDHCSQEGAEKQAQEIQAFWRDQGFAHVHVWTERKDFHAHMRSAFWIIQSNLVDGRPPKQPPLSVKDAA